MENLGPTILFVLITLLICVGAMAIGVMFGRKPIKHCGGAQMADGKTVSCALCGNSGCPNKKKAEAQEAV